MSAVGLDCEWQPTYYGGKGPTETNPTGDNVDHPVATLQLAFRNEVFIIDMLSISGIVTKTKAEAEGDYSTDISMSRQEDLVICSRRTPVLTNANFVQRQRDAKDVAVGKKDHDITKRDYQKRRSSIEESRGCSNRSGEERCCC